MLEYTNIKELITAVEYLFGRKVTNGWKENKYWVVELDGSMYTIKNKETGDLKVYHIGCLRIKCLLPAI